MNLDSVLSPNLRDWLKSGARRNPWRFASPSTPAPIAPIVSPLRYDVLVRAQYFDFYVTHRSEFEDDFAVYAERARSHPYFLWFECVMCVHWAPHLLGDRLAFDDAWAERLRANARLRDSFERDGFKADHPITLYAGRRVLPTATGKLVTRDLYAGDGCHRLALLMSAGQEALLPGQYRVKRFNALQPSDRTAELLETLRLGPDRYRSFLELGYPSARIADGPTGLRVRADDAGTEAEVRAVMAVDEPHLEKGAP